jgi:predicted amidohydrolase YtcJ
MCCALIKNLMKRASVCLILSFLLTPTAVFAADKADVVYRNGKIFTVDAKKPWAEALAVTGDRFVFVGNDKSVQSYIGEDTRIVDLGGKLVLPGFHDLHVHPDLMWEPKYTGQLQTSPAGPEALKQAILAHAKKNPGEGWIFGGTWAQDAFVAAGVEPTAAFLDSFMPDRPVAILDTSRHNMLVNSKAMEIAGLDENTYEQEHAVIHRDANGKLTGLFSDGAQALLSPVLPLGNWQVMREAYREGQQMLNRYGFIAARSQHVNTERLQGVQALERAGELTVRYDMAISWKNDLHVTVPDRAALLAGERHRYRSKHVNANFVKFHFDGNAGSQSALYLDPYQGTDYHGKTNESFDEMKDLLVQLDREGISVQIHVIGDGAARMAVDAIEYTRKVNGHSGVRHTLLHNYAVHSDDAARYGQLGIAAEFTYNFFSPSLASYMNYFANQVLNEATIPHLLNIRPVIDNGGRAVFGSDLVVSPTTNIFPALSALLNRPDDPKRSITVAEAVQMLTINGAWAMGRETQAGSINTGKYADFVVLDRNWFEIPPKDVAETRVLSTVFEGKEVFKQAD